MSEAVPPTTTPPAALSPQPQSTPAESGSRGIIVQLPPSVTTPLPVGQTLEAVVASRLAASRIAVTTRLGEFVVQTDIAPAKGAKLTMQIASRGAQPAVNIAQQTSPPAAPAARIGISPARIAENPQATAGATQPRTGPAAHTAATTAAATVDSATQLRGSVLSATVLRTFSGNGPQPGNVRSPAQDGALLPARLEAGARLSLRIAAVTRPGTAAPPAPPGTVSFTGTVTGTDPAGNATVRTNTAELALNAPRPLPAGSNLLLQSTGRLLPLLADIAQPHSLATAVRWETLRDAIQSVGGGAGPSAIAQAVPQPGAQFTGALMFFVTALRGGDLRGWLGQDGTRSLEIQGLLGRVADEFGVMQRLAIEPGGQEWRLFLIPILSDGQLHQMRLFVRDKNRGEENEDTADETRFVIEVEFSRLGPFQFDGLARRKSLDLIIRTERLMAPKLRQSITEIFDDTVTALGLHGGLRFRTETPFALQPLRETGLLDETGVVA